MNVRRIYSEPLLYFVLAGACLYGVFAWSKNTDDRRIVVDREQLLGFVRQQSRDFSPGHAEQRLENADPQALQDLIDQFVREEALYREAKALGFSEQDYVIRRRLVQRMELLAQGVATSNLTIDEREAQAHFNENSVDYLLPDRITFSHVYVSARNSETTESLLEQLNADAVGVSESSQYGERFLYHLNYVDRTLDFVSSHFGADFTRALMSLSPASGVWQGPLTSEHGEHLVLFSQHVPARLPGFDEVKDRVMTDVRRDRINRESAEIVSVMLTKYQVENRYTNP